MPPIRTDYHIPGVLVRYALFLIFPLIAGCGHSLLSPERADRGLLIVLVGIDGNSWMTADITGKLASVPYQIEVYDWTLPFAPNLMLQARNRDQALGVAVRVRMYRREHPQRPVVILGYSAGSVIALWAAEAGARADRLVLLSACISENYDIGPACRNSGLVYNLTNPSDGVLWASAATGMMDGTRDKPAGCVGFRAAGPRLIQQECGRNHYQIIGNLSDYVLTPGR